MAWFQVDDGLPMHPKVIAAGNAAMGLWVRAGSWSMHNLTDGWVPNDVVRILGTATEARRLVVAGLWEAKDDGFQFHEFVGPGRQRSRVQVLARREANRRRQESHRSNTSGRYT